MVTDAFGMLLEEIGKIIGISNLKPDEHNSCLIKFPNGTTVQMELDHQGYSLIFGCDLGEIPPGRYRENVFREALIANGKPPPHLGDFSYSSHSNHLLLVQNLTITNINAEKIAQALIPFLEKAALWHEALSKGDVPTQNMMSTSAKGGSGMFGLK